VIIVGGDGNGVEDGVLDGLGVSEIDGVGVIDEVGVIVKLGVGVGEATTAGVFEALTHIVV